jgi:EpsI family protein
MTKVAVALVFIGLNLYTYRWLASDDYIPARASFESFPLTLGDWHCPGSEEMSEDVIAILGVTDYLICTFAREGGRTAINFYAGYHETQTRSDGGKETLIHPPEHCLPGSGWDIIDSNIVPVEHGIPGEAKRVVIAKGNLRNLVYFWYQSRGRVIARNHEKVLYLFLDRAVERRTDGSLIRFTIPIEHGNVEEAEESFRSLASMLMPKMSEYVPN